MSDFLAMGGHGAYVWTAYGISLLTLAAIGSWPLLALRAECRKLGRRLAAEAEAAELAAQARRQAPKQASKEEEQR